MFRRIAVVAYLALASVGCDAAAPVANISAIGSLSDPRDLAGIGLVIGGAEFTAVDFDADGELRTGVPESGSLSVGFWLEQNGVRVAEGGQTLELREDYEWYLRISRGVEPHHPCVACPSPTGFPVAESAQNEPSEQVWLSVAGFPRDDDGLVY